MLSADGRRILFASEANDLAPGDLSSHFDNLFLRDLDRGTTVLVENRAVRYSNVMSPSYAIVPDGEHVTFTATGSELADGDYNGRQDIIVWHHAAPDARPGGPYTVAEGDGVTLDGSNSADPDGSLAGHEWDFDYDGTTFSAAALDGPRTVPVALRITDHLGRQTLASTSVAVMDVAPRGSIGNDGPVDEGGGTVTVSLTGVTDPSPADTADGFRYGFALAASGLPASYAAAGAAAPASFTFDDGTYTVHGLIFDTDGGYTDYTTAVTMNNVAPTVSFHNAATVHDDAAVDELSGNGDLDWFLHEATGAWADMLADKRKNETVTAV